MKGAAAWALARMLSEHYLTPVGKRGRQSAYKPGPVLLALAADRTADAQDELL
jgi:hypothetical protein